MPEISRFYGIIIRMFYEDREHQPPHVHACYNDHEAVFDVNGEMTKGSLPNRAEWLVSTWVQQHREDLLHMWETQDFHKLPPLA